MKFDPSSATPEQEFDPTTAVPEEAPPVRAVLQTAVKQNPDQTARATALGKQYGVPTDVVVRNLQNVELQAAVDKADERLKTSPKLAAAMRKRPEIAPLAHDDIEPLAKIESNFAQIAAASVGQAVLGISEGIWRTPDAAQRAVGYLAEQVERTGLPPLLNPIRGVQDVIRFVSEGRVPAVGTYGGTTQLADKVNDAQKVLSDRETFGNPFADVQTLAQNADKALATAVKTGNLQQASQVLTDPNYWSAFMAQAIPSLYAAMKSGGSTAFMAWMEGMEQAGNAAEFEKKTGIKISDTEFTQAVAQTALVNALLEKYGLDKVLGAKGGGIKGIAKAIFAEGGTEGLQQINSNLSALLAYNPEQSLSEGVLASIMGGAGSGGGMSTAQAAAGKMQEVADKRRQQAAAADTNSNHLAEQLKAAGSSALRERSPEQFRALMGEMTDGKIYVDGQVLNQLPEDVKASLPQAVQDQIATAAATGDVVEISTADALTVAPGTALEEVLVEHARTDPFAMSKADAAEATKLAQSSGMNDAQRLIQQAQDTEVRQAEYDAIHKLYADQLNAAARFRPQVNEAKAHWLASFYTTMAARSGMTPAQFQAAHPVNILGAPTGNGQPVMDQGKPGSVSVEGYHFSAADRSTLTTGAFGTGLRGSARDEIMAHPDARLKQRLSFYVDLGNGIVPESGVGGRAHRAQLTNVYDSDLDPLKLRSGNARDFEVKLLDAGYSGYLTRMGGASQGQVIMLGQQTIQPELLGAQSRIANGQRPPALPQTEPQWTNYATGTPEEMQAQLERMRAKSSWQAYDMRVEGGALQYRKKSDGVLNQSVSSRVPWGKPRGKNAPVVENPLTERLQVGIEAFKDVPDALDNAVALLVTYPNYRPAWRLRTTEAKVGRFIAEVKANLLWLHDLVPAEIRERSKLWYDGANVIANQFVERYDVSLAQASAILAVNSPQTEWFTNVSRAERILDIWTNQQDFRWSDEMEATATEILAKYPDELDEIRGKTLGDLSGDSTLQAMWLRTFDQAHNDRSHRIVTPEGTFGEWVTNSDGVTKSKTAWASFGHIAKSIEVIRDGSIENISLRLGNEHKVRSFYNNIFSPTDPVGDVTIDTHAVAAGLLRPLAGSDIEVGHNLGGGVSNALKGLSGTYGIYAEAYRQAAAERGILPREMQSITWEAVRGLYTDTFKSSAKAEQVEQAWRDFRAGKIDEAGIRERVLELSGGINEPNWWQSDRRPPTETWTSSYGGELSPVRVPGQPADANTGGDPAGSGAGGGTGQGVLAQDGDLNGQAGKRAGRYSSGGLAPLEGAPAVAGATGPDARLVTVAEQYAASIGVDLRRQSAYATVDPERAARIAAAYEAMPHAPNDPAVKAAYDDLIQQTTAQYLALKEAGYQFWFMDPGADPYQGNPWNAMRDLRANQSMAVFPTEAGFGTGGQVNIGLADPNGGPNIPPEAVLEALRVVGAEVEASAIFDSDTEPTLVVKLKKALTKEQGDFLSGLADQEAIAQRTDDDKGALFGPMAEKWGPFNPTYFVTPAGVRADEIANPLLQDTGITWAYGSPDGEQRPVLANDLFRAVHDAFGHGLEGAGFRAQGEENAWQAHRGMFTGPALAALTSETRGQNSWLNYGPHGESNKTAKVEDTVFAEQKTGLMPEWTWTEGVVDPADETLKQAAQTPRGTFNPATLELVLNPNANLSTFFHETGHFFLEVMADIASQPNAPAQIAEDMNTFLKWAGIADLQTWNSLDLDGKRAAHERWAESIEQYVMEGKAPSVELQPLMRRFATWLKSVYGSIQKFLAARGQAPAAGGAALNQVPAPEGVLTDENGKPLVVYHGSGSGNIKRFRSGVDGAAWFAADPKLAGSFASEGSRHGGTLYPVYLRIKNPLDVRTEAGLEVMRAANRQMPGKSTKDQLAPLGYDGLISDEFGGKRGAAGTTYLAFDPKQIVSAISGEVLGQDPAAQPGPPMALNDDIRRVMDRMLATDEQIAQANEVAGLVPDEAADAAAAERLAKRSIADLKWSVRARDQVIAKLQKQAKAIEKDLREQVTVEVDQTPEMRAKRALDALSVTPEYAGILAEHKAARKAAEATVRDEVKAALLATNPEAKGLVKGQLLMKNKRDIDNKVDAAMIKWDQANPAPKRPVNATDADVATVADSFGFESVDAMLQAIDAFGSRADAIDGLTEQRMLEEHGDLIDERAIQEAANEAVHNEARARSLASELRTQREMLNPRQDTGETSASGAKITVNALVEAAKQFAANVVARTTLRDLTSKAWQHTAAERRAAKRWQDATAAGKTQEAAQAKQDQMLNHAAAKAAIDARAEAAKIFEFFKRVAKGNDETVVEKGRDPDIVNAARATLAAYGVQTSTTKRADDYLETLSKNDPETYNVILPMVEGATRNAQPLDALTFEELQALHEEIQAMWFLAKRSRQMEVDGDLLDVQDVAEEVYARLEEIGIPDTLPGETGALTDREIQARRWLQQVPALLRRVEQWAEAKDGKFGGPFSRFIFGPVKTAADAYRTARVDYRKRFQALVDNIAPMMPAKTIAAPELGYVFGRGHNGIGMAELLHAIAHTGNESNKRKLLLGRGWATDNGDGTIDTSKWDAFIARLADEGVLAKGHFDFVQGVWDLMEQTKPLAQQTHRAVFGRYFAEVTADAFVDPFGVPRLGGYIPAQADPLLVQDADLRELLETDNAGMSQAFPATNKGFTKGRVEYNRPLKLDLRTLPQHIDKVLLFSHMEPAVRGVARLLRQPKVSQPLARVDPAAIGGMLKPWLNRSARQTVETPVSADAGLNRVLSTARARVGMALMFANVSNTLQQITGFSSAALKVKPSLMMRAAAQFISSPKKFSQAVHALSPYMADRASNEVSVLSDTMEKILINPGVFARAESWTRQHAYFLQTAMDNVMGPIIWTGAYNQAVAEGMDERMAIRYADGVIRQTQGSTLPEDVSRIETGPAYARVFTQFIGYFNMLANTNGTALQQIAQEQGLKKGAGKAFGVVMLGLLVPIWVAEAIANGMRGGPDDEDDDGYLDDWLAAVFGFGTIRGLLSGVPFVGAAAQSAVNRFNSKPADDKFSLSPTVSVLESAVGAPASVYGAIVDDKNAQKAVRDVSALITVATGLPAMAVARPLGYVAGVADNKIQPTGPVDAVRGLVTGTASPESKQR